MTKEDLNKATQEYVEKNHSTADNDFQNAMNIAVAKAFVAGAEWNNEKIIDKACSWLDRNAKKYVGASYGPTTYETYYLVYEFKKAMKGE